MSASAPLIVLIYCTVAVAGTIPAALPVWLTPPVVDWPILLTLGLCAAGAQLFAARALALAPVGFLAQLDLLGVPIAAMIGWLAFGEVPSMLTGIGAVIVLVAAFAVVMRAALIGVILRINSRARGDRSARQAR